MKKLTGLMLLLVLLFAVVGCSDDGGGLASQPVFSPPGGSYYTNFALVLTSATEGAEIRYTTNGDIPSVDTGLAYTNANPIQITKQLTVKAIAIKAGLADSKVSTAVYKMQVANPVFSISGSVYDAARTVTLSCPTPDAIIHYTTNGTDPSSSTGYVYSVPFLINEDTTVKALAFKAGLEDSQVNSRFISIYTNTMRGAVFLGPGVGTRFQIYAPNATSVYVAGTFNGWSSTSSAMVKNADGVWGITLSSANPGDMYKYVITKPGPSTVWVSDPYGRSFNATDNDNSLILNHSNYSWGDGAWVRPSRSKLVIYEMHVKDFTRNDSDAASGANYLGVIEKIPYLKALGVNAVEIMPIQEWPGGWYSWGYNNNGYFAPENSMANNQANGSAYIHFKQVVDALHQNGIAVILDVVYNHTANDNNLLWMIDNTIYYSGTTPWGNRLAVELPAAYKFVYDNMRYWMDEFHVDGFRLDSTENMDITKTISIVNDLYTQGYSDRYYIFEEFNGTHNTAIRNFNISKGSQVISSWGTGYKSTIWSAINTGSSADLGKITYFSKDDAWNNPMEIVNYFSSHDEGTLQGRHSASKKSVKTAAVHLLTSMGIPMIWMGDEIMRLHYGNHPPTGSGIDEANNIMYWDTLRSSHQDLFEYYSALVNLRLDHPALRLTDGDPAGSGKFSWNTDWSGSFIGYTYKNVTGDNNFVVLINYHKTGAKTYSVTFPHAGIWYQMCDGVSAYQYSPGVGILNLVSPTISITIPANTAYIYMSQQKN